jgi:hypothetical protein
MTNECKYCGAETPNEFCDDYGMGEASCEASYWYWAAHEYRKSHKGEAKVVRGTKYTIGIIIGLLILPLSLAAFINGYIVDKLDNAMRYLESTYYKHRIGASEGGSL